MPLPPFDQAVGAHGLAVLRVCRALLGPDDAEDAWAETFLAALRAYPSLPEESNVRGWLVTIAHNKAVDRQRAKARAPLPSDQLTEVAAPIDEPDESDGVLWSAVRALPPKQRSAVAYRYLADLPYAEVAGLLGTSVVAARRNASDGIAALRAGYTREDDR